MLYKHKGGINLRKFDRVFRYYDNFMDLFNLYKIEEIKKALDLHGDEVVIDIGGGTGRLAEYLSDNCRIVYVLDESEGMLSRVKKNPKVVTKLGSALDTPFDSSSVDVVIMSDVFHHIKNQPGLVEEIHRVLKKNGRIVILDFEKKNIKTKVLRVFEFLLFGRLYFRTSKEIINLLQDKFVIKKFIDNKYYFIIEGEKHAE